MSTIVCMKEAGPLAASPAPKVKAMEEQNQNTGAAEQQLASQSKMRICLIAAEVGVREPAPERGEKSATSTVPSEGE